MPLVPMSELLAPALEAGYAVPAFATWNAEIARTVLAVAAELRAPVILMHSVPDFPMHPAAGLCRRGAGRRRA